MPDYMYGPLETPEHIRLLKVLDPPDAKDEAGIGEAYFNIVVLSLNEAPVYECVSYAWISKKRDRRLCVRDGSEVAVTASLLGALPYLARASDTGYLWIDQLCINKDDLEERSSQISLMSRIYSQAKRLLVWLGPESSNASLVCQLMEQMASRSDWLLKAACGRHALSQWRVWADNEVIEAFFVAEAEKLCFKHLHTNEHQRENEHELDIAGVATSYRNAALRVFDLPWVCCKYFVNGSLADMHSLAEHGSSKRQSSLTASSFSSGTSSSIGTGLIDHACSSREPTCFRPACSTIRAALWPLD